MCMEVLDGKPAARVGDACTHGGSITGPGCTSVLIGDAAAARGAPGLGESVTCPLSDGPRAHVGGTIVAGSSSVLIGELPAARVDDPIGPPGGCTGNSVSRGDSSVVIGG